ncbi:complex I NDUFA9 subunit family protein [Brevundimonas sp. NPDC090276]|uniref:complex I NDUFA9 subunit family protein n=1 Tax=Brevundimonas sp. NPDC090276 TaxID=3363956 RepID=UPI00383A7964
MADFAPGLVTVFGGSGFVGTQVVRALAKRGWRVRVAVRKPALAYELRMAGDVGQIQTLRCDITDKAAVAEAIKGADAVINLVGILFETGGRKFEALHVEGAVNVAEAAKTAGVQRLVHMSALGGDVNGKAAYARTKGAAEAAVRAAFPGAVVIRPSVIFGSDDAFLNKFAAMATFSPALPLIGGGVTKFQPVYVGDVAEAIARATVSPDAEGKTFELGGPSIWTFEDILKFILRETKRERFLIPLPFPIARMIGSFAQIPAAIGLKPALTRDQVLLLEGDNVVSPGAEGLAELGVEPTGLEAIAPSYLFRYRVGGQYAESPAAA